MGSGDWSIEGLGMKESGLDDFDDDGVILILNDFLHVDCLISYTTLVRFLTRQSFELLHIDQSISYAPIDLFLARRFFDILH